MNDPDKVVFLLDVDNTLLNNDDIISGIDHHLAVDFGDHGRHRYWEIADALRIELGYVDYLGALQKYRSESKTDPRLFSMSAFFLDYPFADRVYPQAFELIKHLNRWGKTVIVSDGDIVFQPRKIQHSGLWDAVDARVLIYEHKESMLADIEQRFPAQHYIMVDDKLQILTAMKTSWASRLTTVFVRQGHYALDPVNSTTYPAADVSVESIADLIQIDPSTFLMHN
jgi:FMN phosphatase YigB (HAD superfamily)